MRAAYALEALVEMAAGADDRAPGGAVTLELCGSWDHEPPCPEAPHHTGTERAGIRLRVRVLFAVDPARETAVRERIEAALATGHLVGPDGVTSEWRLVSTADSPVLAAESDHADRLRRG
jgi:hypothetical protein